MISHWDLKVQEYERGKELVTREAWFGAKTALIKENALARLALACPFRTLVCKTSRR